MRLSAMLIFALSIINGTVVASSTQITKSITGLQYRTYQVHDFNRIVADGYFNLKINRAQGKSAAIATRSYNEAPISISVQDHVLYILSSADRYLGYANQHPQVNLTVPTEVKSIMVHGPTNVTSNIASSNLKLVADGFGIVKFQNVKQLDTISLHGNNVINIAGIHTNKLSVYLSGSSRLNIQGTVNHLYARLDDNASLHARNLAAEHITVQAKGDSQAYIYPQKTLRAFAEDAGVIYYYKHLNNLTSYPIQSGNVLQMKW